MNLQMEAMLSVMLYVTWNGLINVCESEKEVALYSDDAERSRYFNELKQFKD